MTQKEAKSDRKCVEPTRCISPTVDGKTDETMLSPSVLKTRDKAEKSCMVRVGPLARGQLKRLAISAGVVLSIWIIICAVIHWPQTYTDMSHAICAQAKTKDECIPPTPPTTTLFPFFRVTCGWCTNRHTGDHCMASIIHNGDRRPLTGSKHPTGTKCAEWTTIPLLGTRDSSSPYEPTSTDRFFYSTCVFAVQLFFSACLWIPLVVAHSWLAYLPTCIWSGLDYERWWCADRFFYRWFTVTSEKTKIKILIKRSTRDDDKSKPLDHIHHRSNGSIQDWDKVCRVAGCDQCHHYETSAEDRQTEWINEELQVIAIETLNRWINYWLFGVSALAMMISIVWLTWPTVLLLHGVGVLAILFLQFTIGPNLQTDLGIGVSRS